MLTRVFPENDEMTTLKKGDDTEIAKVAEQKDHADSVNDPVRAEGDATSGVGGSSSDEIREHDAEICNVKDEHSPGHETSVTALESAENDVERSVAITCGLVVAADRETKSIIMMSTMMKLLWPVSSIQIRVISAEMYPV
ncbi:hypothetical protein GN244_ATG07290 [Phytophthora infestans]|uniref:Uncharacterized protein n=1 Tax=Phytophthora infestans TaxID=4787 RepID=A0A833WL53_PHYIN|nr:hypothetical protein GN244_ATG07290 [Phytophthora infestans]